MTLSAYSQGEENQAVYTGGWACRGPLHSHYQLGTAASQGLRGDAILIARNLGPAELLEYDKRRLKGVILEEGSLTAHVVIVARAMGVPVLGRVRNLRGLIREGDQLLLDADQGTADIRPLPPLVEAFEARFAKNRERQAGYAALRDVEPFTRDGTRITVLAAIARAVCIGLRRHPELNSSWDEPAQEIVQHGAIHLGIAAATPRGLIVPNIPDAGSLDLLSLARALAELTEAARAGRTEPARLVGGTFTITNVGVFGVEGGAPILNPGEAAILAFGAVREQPWVHVGQIAIREVTTLSLSFDHRIVDGQLGSEFLADLAGMLNDPWKMVDFTA